MLKLFRIMFVAVLFTFTTPAFANLKADIVGTDTSYVSYEKPITIHQSGKHIVIKEHPIQLMRVKLTPESRQWLIEHIRDKPEPPLFQESNTLPSSKFLEMNGVPVLDQGQHGSCVTFAASAGVDAIIGHGDYISQLCTLSLTKFYHKQSPHYYNGWIGTTNELILRIFTDSGINSMDTQKTYGCAGVKKYPKNSNNTGKPMSPTEYKIHSEYVMDNIAWHEVRQIPLPPGAELPNLLEAVKISINNGNRVLLAFLLAKGKHSGAIGTSKTAYDSWIVTDKTADAILNDNFSNAHEVVVTGYDDNAVIRGPKCTYHRGVLILRNSWGKNAGDKGTFYMSYDYLFKMTLDAYVLVPQ